MGGAEYDGGWVRVCAEDVVEGEIDCCAVAEEEEAGGIISICVYPFNIIRRCRSLGTYDTTTRGYGGVHTSTMYAHS